MKKTLSMFLSVMLLLTMLLVPVNVADAATDEYLKHYIFSFAQDDIYAYAANSKDAATTMEFTPTGGTAPMTIAPLHEASATGGWDSVIFAKYSAIDIGGKTTDSLNIKSANDTQFVPIMENGKPFELAPGHTYTVKMEYTHSVAATGDNWYSTGIRGLYVGGGFIAPNITADVSRVKATVPAFGDSYAARPYSVLVDDLFNIDSTGVISKTVSFTTPDAIGEGYTYDAGKNAYTTDVTIVSDSSKVSKDFYNYLYFHFEHYSATELNILYLEITRDDCDVAEALVEYIDEDGSVLKTETSLVGNFPVQYTPDDKEDKAFLGWYLDESLTVPAGSTVELTEAGLRLYSKWGTYVDWSAELEDKYIFDFSNDGYFADVPNKEGQSVIDATKNWTYAPVSIDPGVNRESRNIYPVYSTASTSGWGPQTWAEPSSVEYEGKSYNSYKVSSLNPSVFVPLKEDGKPFEMAPGHKYSIKLNYYMNSYDSGSPMLQCDVGVASNGTFIQNSQTTLNDTAVASTRIGWIYGEVGKLVEKNFTVTVPAANDSNFTYDNLQNTFTKNINGTDYTLYNYLCFSLTNYGKPVIEFVSLEITRDDYVATGTVEYIDQDGTVLKSEEVVAGEYSINFIPENTAEKYFAGWYLDDEYTSRVASDKVPMSVDGLKLYAKWEDYKDSVVSTNDSYYYGTAFVPSLTADGVYSHSMSTRSNVGQTAIGHGDDYFSLSTSFWGDGILITAADDVTGELFRAKPNTTYRISLKFRITSETTRADGIDVAIYPGAGLPDTAARPMGKYYDENSLKAKGNITRYTDGVTAEGKYITYNAVYTTGDFTTIPAIGVELWLYQDAAVEIYSLSVSKFDGESLPNGEFLVSKEVKNNTTYMINFDYSLNETPAEDIGIGFKTTASDTVGYPSFIEGENVAIYTVKSDLNVGEWYTATVLITTDMYANVQNSFGYDDVLTALNTNLYGYVIGDDTYSVGIKNVKLKELCDAAGNGLVNAVGGQCLTDDAEALAGQQALRYSFSYDTVTGNEIIIDGKEYTVKERGFIYVNGNNYAKGGLYKADFNLTNAKAGKFIFNSKNKSLDVCWKHTQIGDTGYSNLVFSTYVKDFETDDTKELMVKAFVIVEIDGQEFTVYSDSVNRSVAYLKSLA